jgi:hypothetical protein
VTTDPQTCPNCQHPHHLPGTECETPVNHAPNRWHLCLCLARPGAALSCPPQMTCQGGTLGYADIWYLQHGHMLVGADGEISPEAVSQTGVASVGFPSGAPDQPADAPAAVPPADRAELRERIAGLFRHPPGVERLGDATPGEIADAVMAALPADASEVHRLALSDALGLGTSAPWDAIRERAAELQAEVASLTEASRRLLEQRQEMAEERYAWQERGDRAEERVRALEAGQAALSDTDRQFLTFALELAADEMASRGDEFGDEDEAALETLRRLAAGTGEPVKPTSHAWTFEVCYDTAEDKWHGCGATYDDSVFGNAHETAREDFQYRAENDKQRRRFRMIRATTTYAVEAEHAPAEEPAASRTTEYRHTCHDQTSAPGRDYDCQWCSTLPESLPAVVAEPGKEA